MTIAQAAILGIVQGLTEFLPVSSSGHLILFPALLDWNVESIAFDVAVHVATLGAVLIALWPRLSALVKDALRGNALARDLFAKLIVATIPAALFGVLAGAWLETQRNLFIIAIMLIVWGVVLWIADYLSTRVPRRVMKDDRTSWPLALGIGIAQAFALIPGTSRSGVTMSVGLLAGLDRKTAATFSFLLAIPAILGAGLMTTIDVVRDGLDVPVSALVIGCLTALVSGIFAIKFLFAIIDKGGFKYFAWYRIALGVVLLWFVLHG